jgi:peptidoglycan/LPS O-acetylase OafA/YrhL
MTRRWGWSTLAVIFAGSIAYNALALNWGDVRMARQLPGQLQFFVVGIALSLRHDPIRVHPLVSIAITAVFLAAWTLIVQIPPGIRPLLVAALVYSFAFSCPVIPLRRDLSYSVYLVHGPLLQTLILLGLFHDSLLFMAVVVAAVLSFSAISERLVERPGIAFGQRLSRLVQRRPLRVGARVA